MDFSTVVELLSFAVLEALPVATAVVVTLFPERWTRLTRDCPSSSITVIADCCVYEKNNVVFVSDVKKRAIVAVQLHCPVVTSLVAGGGEAVAGQPGFGKGAGFTAPAGLVVRNLWLGGGKGRGAQQWWSPYVFAADTGSGSIVAIDVGPCLQQQMRVVDGDADVAGFEKQAVRPGDAPPASRRNRLAYSSTINLSFADGATMTKPFAMCFGADTGTKDFDKVKLYVTDIAKETPSVVFVDAKNTKFNNREERPAFTATVSRVVALPAGSEPRAIACHRATNRLFVGDARSPLISVIDPKPRPGQILQSVNAAVSPLGAGPSGAGPWAEQGVWGLAVRADGLQLAATLWPSSIITMDLHVDQTSELVVGSPHSLLSADQGSRGTQHDDLARLATTSRPRGLAFHGNSLIFADAANGVRLVTSSGPLRSLLQMFAPLAASIGYLPQCATLSWTEGEAALESIMVQVRDWEAEAMRRTGKTSPGAMQGPQGMISGSVRRALGLLLSSVQEVRAWLKSDYNIDLDEEGVTFDRLLTLCCENFFSKVRCGPTGSSATPMELEYRERRAALIAALLRERFSYGAVQLFTSASSYYPEPPGLVALAPPCPPPSLRPAHLSPLPRARLSECTSRR